MNYIKQFICFLFIGFVFFVGFTASNKAEVNAFVENSNYVYLELEKEDIIDDNGVVLLKIEHEKNGLEIKLNISKYDYYKLSYKDDGLTNIYVADVHENENLKNKDIIVTNIKIFNKFNFYFDSTNQITLEVSCYDPNSNKLYTTNGIIDNSIFNRLTEDAILKVLSDDKVSKKLIESLNSVTDFQAINDDTNVSTNNNMNIQSTIDFDDYTNSDFLNVEPFTGIKIQDYFNEELFLEFYYSFDGDRFIDEAACYEDDPIIGIIPKELFYTPGSYSHLGKSYGFYVKTKYENSNEDSTRYSSEVFVFDLTKTWPSSVSREAKIKVEPLFQFKYECFVSNTLKHPFKNRITVLKEYGSPIFKGRYCLGSVSFDFNLYNPYATNQWEEGYEFKNQNGIILDKSDYISVMSYEIVGTPDISPNEGKETLKNALEFGYSLLQYVPGVRDLVNFLSIVETGVKGYELISGKSITPEYNTTADEVTITSSYTTPTLTSLDSLVKSAYMYMNQNLVIDSGQHAFASIIIDYSDENLRNHTGIVSNIQLDVYFDTSKTFFFIPYESNLIPLGTLKDTSSIIYRSTNFSYVEDININGINISQEKEVSIYDKKTIKYFYNKPESVNAQQVVINFDSKLYNDIYADISVIVYDIDWNKIVESKNSTSHQLFLNLDAGRYYIEATINSPCAKYSFSIFEHRQLSDGEKIVYNEDYSDIFGFTVNESKYYEFGIRTKPVLEGLSITCNLYDIHGNLIMRQIDSSIQLIVKLNAGEKYHIEYWVRQYPFNGSFTFQFHHRDDIIYSDDNIYIDTINNENINFTRYGAISIERWVYDQGWQYLGTSIFTQNGTKDNITINNNTITLGTYNGKQLMTNSVIGHERYRVTFNLNGGDQLYPNYIDVTYNMPYGTLPTPTRADGTFAGWYTYDGRSITSSSIVSIEDDHTLYASWVAHLPLIELYRVNGTTEEIYQNSWHGFSVESEDLLAMGYNQFLVTILAVEEGRYVTFYVLFTQYGYEYITYNGMTIEVYFSFYYEAMEGGVFVNPDKFVGSPHIVSVLAYTI